MAVSLQAVFPQFAILDAEGIKSEIKRIPGHLRKIRMAPHHIPMLRGLSPPQAWHQFH